MNKYHDHEPRNLEAFIGWAADLVVVLELERLGIDRLRKWPRILVLEQFLE